MKTREELEREYEEIEDEINKYEGSIDELYDELDCHIRELNFEVGIILKEILKEILDLESKRDEIIKQLRELESKE